MRGQALHVVRGAGATATDEMLQYQKDGTFTFRNTRLRFHREGGKVMSLRLDNVGANVRLTRPP